MKPCKIRINNPEHSKAVQKHLFDQGYCWAVYGKTCQDWPRMWEEGCFLHSNAGGALSWDREPRWSNYKIEEIDLQHLDPHLSSQWSVKGEENTLTRLRKAQEALLQAEQNYTNASEALGTAEEAHTEALEAFRKEAVGLLGESFKTPSERSQEDMSDISNWRRGDVLLCKNSDSEGTITPSKFYAYIERSPFFPDMARIVNDQGRETGYTVGYCLEWHSRPSKD